MPNNHSKYCIPGGLRVGGAPVSLHRDHCRPGIHPPASLGGEALDLQAAAGKEGVDGAAGASQAAWFGLGDDDPPSSGLYAGLVFNRPIEQVLTYRVPVRLAGLIRVGQRVHAFANTFGIALVCVAPSGPDGKHRLRPRPLMP